MKLVVFGLSVTSTSCSGHATLWRGILRALVADGHEVVFFERDTPAGAAHRDLARGDGYEIVVYPTWADVASRARREVRGADVAIVTSCLPDAAAATELVVSSQCGRVFYVLDAASTLARHGDEGALASWLPAGGLGEFDLVLSAAGGAVLGRLRNELGARRVAPLFACVDADAHCLGDAHPDLACDLSYLGSYFSDRQPAVESLFLDVAEQAPARRLVLAGSRYPEDMRRPPNVTMISHVSAGAHSTFYGSSRLTLNLTRGATATMGFCPSPRLFEAAACGVPVVTDEWQGVDAFFVPGEEIFVARGTDEVLATLELPREALAGVARRARERVLDEHTAAHRARELVEHVRALPGHRAAEEA